VKKIIAVLSALTLSACSGAGAWTKAGSSAKPNNDILQCQYDARKHAPYDGMYGRNTTAEEGIFIMCMKSRGWQWGEVKKRG